MLNITSISNAQEQLFTDLTPEEGAIIEGGATLTIHEVYCIQSREDGPFSNGDDLYIKVNGSKIFGKKNDVDGGESFSVNESKTFSDIATISLFDDDPWYDPSGDDDIGSFSVSSTPTSGRKTVQVGSSNSLNLFDSGYNVTYSVS